MSTKCQTQNPKCQNPLILENPNSDIYHSLCNFKERQESIAVEKLRSFEEITKSKALCQKFFGFSSWSRLGQPENLQDEQEDGITLMYKLMSLEDGTITRKKRKNKDGFLSGWDICGNPLHREVGYLKGKLTWKNSTSTARKEIRNESFSHSPTFNLNKKEAFFQCKPRNWEFSEARGSKKEENSSDKEESAHGHSGSPHTTIKFHRFSNTNDYIKYYRDKVTHTGIRQHFYNHVEAKAGLRLHNFPLKRRPNYGPHFKRDDPKIYRLQISNDSKSFGILKVGPCPSFKIKKAPKKAAYENEAESLAEKLISDSFNRELGNKRDVATKQPDLEMDPVNGKGSRLPSGYSSYTTNNGKTRRTFSIPTANTTDFDEVSAEAKNASKTIVDEELKKDEDKITKVQLQVNKTPAPSVRRKKGKASRFNRPKLQNQVAVANKTRRARSSQRLNGISSTSTNTLGEKEFLRITKPKVIGVNPAIQKGKPLSPYKLNSSTSGDQPEVLYPWVDMEGGIPRGRLIEASQIMNRQFYNNRFPEKGFQACITPSSYPKRGMDVKIQLKTEELMEDDSIQV